tara:strand:- start:2033 stop:2395 length:363 start_codon:yes stop_codon:yes gene_type:complete
VSVGKAMGTLGRYRDTGSMCFANVKLDSGEPCFISVAQEGVIIRRSVTGLFGQIVFRAKSDELLWQMIAQLKDKCGQSFEVEGHPEIITPTLAVLVNIALIAKTTDDLSEMLAAPISAQR